MVELIDDHIQHVKSCTLDACFRCLYIRNQHKWKKKLPWLTDRMWKSCSRDNDDELVWGLGCRICIRAGLSSASLFASSGFGEDAGGFHGFSSVMRHTRSKAHQKAVKQLNCEDGSNEAPSEEQFGQFMKERFSSDILDSLFFFIVLMLNACHAMIHVCHTIRTEAIVLEFPPPRAWWSKEDDEDAALCWSSLRGY